MGFDLDFWDYATFVTFLLAGIAGVVIALFIAGLPGRIAIAQAPGRRGGEHHGLRRLSAARFSTRPDAAICCGWRNCNRYRSLRRRKS